MRLINIKIWSVGLSLLVASCSSLSYVQRNSPSNAFKDYDPKNAANASILGVGQPISERQMSANATISMQGSLDLEQVMKQLSGTYNVAVRWGNGVRKGKRADLLINKLTFNDARTYIEDVYDVQIIREGERRILVLPSASELRLKTFNPGDNISLSVAIKGLAEQCGYNIVINENKEKIVAARVSTNLKDVTCTDAFEAILSPQNLSLVDAGDYYTISGLPQRQWTIDLFEPERSEKSSVKLSSDYSAGSGDSGAGGSSSGSNEIEVTYTRDLWKELEGDLNILLESGCSENLNDTSGLASNELSSPNESTLLPPPVSVGATPPPISGIVSTNPTMVPETTNQEVGDQAAQSEGGASCGYVRINRSVGLIQMRGPRSTLEEADEMIQRVQEIASRRILLEARVLAVSRTRSFNQAGKLGGGIGDRRDSTLATGGFAGSVDSTFAPNSSSSITSALANEVSRYSINNAAAGGFSIINNNLNAVVGLAEKFGTTTELMHPMIELMDRQRAVLIDGRNEKYFVISSESTTGTSTTTSNSLDERNQFIGLQFSASAQISADAATPHTVSIQIPITSISREVDIPNPNNPSQSTGKAPIASTRLIDQKVRVRDGEIKVIGGLTKTVAVDTESGVPILRDISAIGRLVNEQGVTYEQIEFVVLLQVRRLT